MSTGNVHETAISIDHESGECRVDTTQRGIAADLRRRGFEEVTTPDSRPYRRFIGQADQLRFRLPKGKRRVAGAAAKNTPEIHHGGENEPGLGRTHRMSRGADLASKIAPEIHRSGENDDGISAPSSRSRTGGA